MGAKWCLQAPMAHESGEWRPKNQQVTSDAPRTHESAERCPQAPKTDKSGEWRPQESKQTLAGPARKTHEGMSKARKSEEWRP